MENEGMEEEYEETDHSEAEINELRRIIQDQQELIENYEQEARAMKRQQAEHQQEQEALDSVIAKDGYHLTKEEALALIEKISSDKTHPYLNDKAPIVERERAIALVNRLYSIVNGTHTSVEGYLTDLHKEKEERLKGVYNDSFTDKHSRFGESHSEEPATAPDDIGTGEKDLKSGHGNRIEDA